MIQIINHYRVVCDSCGKIESKDTEKELKDLMNNLNWLRAIVDTVVVGCFCPQCSKVIKAYRQSIFRLPPDVNSERRKNG